MKFILLLFLSLGVVHAADLDTTSWPTCNSPNRPQIPDVEKTMKPVFSGGKSCKKSCVTFHKSHNGTKRALLPNSTFENPKKCVIGKPCRICFKEGSSCITTDYQGDSSRKWTLNLSPSFFNSQCGRNENPVELQKECKAIKSRVMHPTIYSDGYSCPKQSKGCTVPHVVFNKVHNGSARAFLPSSSVANPKKCKVGKNCRVCFKHGEDCMDVLYLGSGPSPWRLDFPPAFYKSQCKNSNNPNALKKQCSSFKKIANRLKGEIDSGEKINCFQNPTHRQCADLLRNAAISQSNDDQKRQVCLSLGQKIFNATRPESKQRIYGCNYSKLSKSWEFPNKKKQCIRKTRWKILLPGSCPKGTFVGKFGLNCCGKDIFSGVATGSGCKIFFPKFDVETPVQTEIGGTY